MATANDTGSKKVLSPEQREELLRTVKARFEKNIARRNSLKWADVQAKLEAEPSKLWSLNEMERTGGEPDVTDFDEKTNEYGISRGSVGWRVDCLGDMGGFSPTWNHMEDYYPQSIINFGMRDAWEKAPVSLEVCWVMEKWKIEGWDVDKIIDESLKWHISSFNSKSSPVPVEWEPNVKRWLNRMGYRLVLRKFTYPASIEPNGTLAFTSWWENKGVAPCYKPFSLALRLIGPDGSEILMTGADINSWLPGDNLYDGKVFVPSDIPPGEYELALAIVDENQKPRVRLAIEGRRNDGWYRLGTVQVIPRSWKTLETEK